MNNTKTFSALNAYRRWGVALSAIFFVRRLSAKKATLLLTRRPSSSVAFNLQYPSSSAAIDLHPSSASVASNYHPDVDHHWPAENEPIHVLDVDSGDLGELVRTKNLESLKKFGGVKKVVEALESDTKRGLSGTDAELIRRKHFYGANEYQKPPAQGLLNFVFEAFKDTVVIILLGIKQYGWKDGWFDGGSIILVVFFVLAFSAVSNFNRSRQFQKVSKERGETMVEVIRNGRRRTVTMFDIVVGDVVRLKIGDQVPADGLFLEGHSLKVDESSLTGESDHVEINAARNPFLLSGTKVTDGRGTMVVTAVGMSTAWGEMMSCISKDYDEETPLQARLKHLTSFIEKVGLCLTVIVLIGLMISYIVSDEKGLRELSSGSKTKFDVEMNSILGIVATAVTIVVVVIPKGLPLAVTLTLAYSTKQMIKDNAMIRKLSACETMGSATIICTDKTGTLTLNEMKLTEVWLGIENLGVDGVSEMSPTVVHLLREAIALNTTGSVDMPSSPESAPEISGSPTEKAILSWGVSNLGLDIDEVRTECEIIQEAVFNSERKRSGVLIRRNHEKPLQSHWKGAAEMVIAMCSNYYDRDGNIRAMNDEDRRCIEVIIQNMAAKSLRCIAFAHKKLERENGHEKLEESGLTLLCIAGLKDPCRREVRKAVDTCIAAGVDIKMITGDNVHTARAIANECGILKPVDSENRLAVVEGVQFRSYSAEERKKKVDRIRVMARSSALDKRLMVECLKQNGHVVMVTGDGTNDAPALKEADIGISMGIQGTEVAKESSDIVSLDDNFSLVVNVLKWGRCVFNNIQKFILFQLTMNIAALIINFVAVMSSGKVPLTAVQLLWVNLKMDILAALAFATELPTNELMKKPPMSRNEPLITRIMWRNLIAQVLFQVTGLLILQFKGRSIFGVNEKVKNTLIFNTFVLCQVFNEFNARKFEKRNMFEGIHRNKLFLAIIGVTVLLQVFMVELFKTFASGERLNWGQWGASIGIAALSWPVNWLVNCFPVSGNQVLFNVVPVALHLGRLGCFLLGRLTTVPPTEIEMSIGLPV